MKSLIRIKDIIDLAVNNGVADSSIFTFIFSHIRIALEKRSEKQKYPFLFMVCNWYQHCEIDKSTVGYEIIKNVGDAFFDAFIAGGGQYDKLTKNISIAFGMENLKHQLHDFFTEHDINHILVDNKNWDRFLIGVLYDLSERPLRIPDMPIAASKKLSKTEAEAKRILTYLEKRAMDVRPKSPGMVTPVAFSIVFEGNIFYWVIEMKDMVELKGALIELNLVDD